MCLNPSKISEIGWVACRKCWQCRERKVDDWVGRNIAEMKMAKASHAVTLTYGRDPRLGTIDNLRAAVLTYSDVQKMLKHLRADGFPVRYFVTGEYGSKKGRAHWHILFYWQAVVPEINLNDSFFLWKYWQHGWSHWTEVGQASARYACKYLIKEMDDDAAQVFGPMPSKKPPLGDAYFRDLAQQYVDAGLAPQNLYYSFPEVRRVPRYTAAKTIKRFRDAAQPIQFLMSGKTAENFCGYFVKAWRERYDDEPPASEPIWDYLETEFGGKEHFIPYHMLKRPQVYPHDLPEDGSGVTWDRTLNCHVKTIGGDKFYLREIAGVRQWQKSAAVPWDILFRDKGDPNARN